MGFIKRITSLWGKDKDPEPVGIVEKPAKSEPAQSRSTPIAVPRKEAAPAATPVQPQFLHETAPKSVNGSSANGNSADLPWTSAQQAPAVRTELEPLNNSSVAVLVENELVKDPFSAASKNGSNDLFSGFSDDDFDDLDAAFDAVLMKSDDTTAPVQAAESVVSEGMLESDQSVVADLFADIAASYARPVKNFIFELKRGTATKEWIDICRPAMRSISKAAENMGLTTASERMNDFDEALSLALDSDARVLGGDIREMILACYFELVDIMPQAFTLGEEEQLREGVIINSLLKQIPDLGRVTVDKMYSAGLTSLDTLFMARKEELTLVTGIPMKIAERICEKFQEYRRELEGDGRDISTSGRLSRLKALADELSKQHDIYTHASATEPSTRATDADKRKSRQERESCCLKINVVLAEMGEIELVEELQKLSFERRIQRLDDFLATAAQ